MQKDFQLYNKKFLLDSWAYTAFTQNKIINIDEYIDFIKKNKKFIWIYANLDVIWNWEATLKNQEYMEKKWLNPLPTYHLWSPIEYFKDMVKKYDYIGLWWMVLYKNKPKKIEQFLDYCFSYILKNWYKTKIHGWGLTNIKLVKKYPFYSIDSTKWLNGWKYNNFMFFEKNTINQKLAIDMRKKLWIDFAKLTNDEKGIWNIREYVKYILYVNKLQKAKKMDYYNY